MLTKVILPDLYRVKTGATKKKFAWSYLQRYYPDHEPLGEQPLLEGENILICKINFEKARQLSSARVQRQSENKKKKR